LGKAKFAGGDLVICGILGIFSPESAESKMTRLSSLSASQASLVCEMLTRIVFEKILTAGDHALDIGANEGYHTVALSHLVGPNGLVHAFEPNIAHFPKLTAIAPNVRLWPFALGNELSIQCLHVPDGLDGWASLTDIRSELPDRQFRLLTTVQLKLDQLMSEIEPARVTFIKIDAERQETSVLDGMVEFLGRAKAAIVIELGNPQAATVLSALGYQLFKFDGEPWVKPDYLISNAVAVPGEKTSLLQRWLPTPEEIELTVSEALQLRPQ
jgi:FkbM family methyltransferase